MTIYIDIVSKTIVTDVAFASPVRRVDFKRGDAAEITVVFVENNAVVPTADMGLLNLAFGIKPQDEYDTDFLVYTDSFTSATNSYGVSPSFNTTELDDALGLDGDPANDVAYFDCNLEITWSDDGTNYSSSNTQSCRIFNDVIRGDESSPAELPSPEEWLGDRAVLTDQAITDPDLNFPSISTTEKDAGTLFGFIYNDEFLLYRLESNTTAHNPPSVVRPSDYAASTNEKVWVQTDYSMPALNVAGVASVDSLDGNNNSLPIGSTIYVDQGAGLVGIGAAASVYTLEVGSGDLYTSNGITTDGDLTANGSATLGALLYVDQPNGYVGVGQSSPSYKLDVSGDIRCNNITSNNATMEIQAVLYVDGAGQYVGIGNSVPSYPLDVNGSAYFSSGTLTCDSTAVFNADADFTSSVTYSSATFTIDTTSEENLKSAANLADNIKEVQILISDEDFDSDTQSGKVWRATGNYSVTIHNAISEGANLLVVANGNTVTVGLDDATDKLNGVINGTDSITGNKTILKIADGEFITY